MIELADFSSHFNQERIGRFDSAIYPDGNQAVSLSHTPSLSEKLPQLDRNHYVQRALQQVAHCDRQCGDGSPIVAFFAVGHDGYARMFFIWASSTLLYFLIAAFWLPETKGRSLEQIEASFR